MRDQLEVVARVKNQAEDRASVSRSTRGPGTRAVRRQLELILERPDFDASQRSREFLRFIVEETLAGRGDQLTQVAIATAVFGRTEDFDPIVDPIVRIQAGRLRRSLERYYLLSGRQDVLGIELPKGSYMPAFRVLVPVADPAEARPAPTDVGDGWPATVFVAFEAGEPNAQLQAMSERMSEELALELGRYAVVHVLRHRAGNGLDPSLENRTRFVLDARAATFGHGLRVTAHLTDRVSGQEIWGDEYVTYLYPGQGSPSPEDVARVIAARIGAEEGVIVQYLAVERRKRRTAGVPTPFDALLLSYEASMAREPETFALALEALRAVVRVDPDCGWAWTRLARLCLANLTFEVTTSSTPLDEAIAFAQRGVRADPSSRIARCILASALLVKNELAAGRVELEHALRSSSNSLAYLDVVGYLLTLLGSWDRGREISRAALERNPHCLPHVQFGLWVGHLHHGEVEEAHQAALEFRDPTFFMRFAMRATCLGLLGRTDEGRLEVAQLLAAKPDFAARGRHLLGYYIKFPEVMDRIVDGLARVGLKIE